MHSTAGEGLDMTAAAFEPSFFCADDPLVGSLPPATDLSGTVSALVTNLKAEAGAPRWRS